jgi:hypothetical protein
VGPQDDLFGAAELDVEGVPHRPGRVGGGHVEGFEVVPVGLDLGTFGHLVAQGEEDLLQFPLHLGDGVEVAPFGVAGGQGEIEPVDQLGGRRAHHLAPVGQHGGDLGPVRREGPAGGGTVGGVETADRLLRRGQEAALAQRRPLRLVEGGEVGGPADGVGGPHGLRVEAFGDLGQLHC